MMKRMSDGYIKSLRHNLRRAIRARDLGEAEQILMKLKHSDPLSPHTRGSELEILIHAGRTDEAVALAELLCPIFPESARVQYLCGRAFYKVRDYERAIACFAENDRLNPHWLARLWLGKAYTQAGDFGAAEAALLDVAGEHAMVLPALGWLYERTGDLERAVENYSAFLEEKPDDEFVKASLARVQTEMASVDEIQTEVETLVDFGEDIPPEMLPKYIESLLTTGQRDRVERLLPEIEGGSDARVITRVAWICHRLQLPDLAYRLFMNVFGEHHQSIKFLHALEADAERCGKLEALRDRYRESASENPKLWGGIKRIEKRMRTAP